MFVGTRERKTQRTSANFTEQEIEIWTYRIPHKRWQTYQIFVIVLNIPATLIN